VDENRLARELPVCLVDEEGYYFEAYVWPWTVTDVLVFTGFSVQFMHI
jgi:hypothetical protein